MQCVVTADPDVKVDPRTLAFWCEAVDAQSVEFSEALGIAYVPVVYYAWDVLLRLTDDEVMRFVADSRLMTIQNDIKVPGALGFHDAIAGVIFSRVKFTGDTTPITLSHEKLEMDGDPLCDVWIEMDAAGTEQAKEVCDRVENDSYIETAEIGGDTMPVPLSNYLLPSAFVPGSMGPWDRMRRLTSWNGMTEGGYMLTRDAHRTVRPVFAHVEDRQARQVFAHKQQRTDSRVARRLGGA